ncbi:DUF2752 domain-containing protein [Streptomyces spororaveus]|uniref:DUF2752 domain-containing protein n=1 Tax=Streptomyces spororaveus TaxID=284039 RepID=UPI001921D035|nr:DUF2752 domain-containing protein [Streptomyces spororaveus]MCM9079011.1 DUF2752 domain-containing protein [Streptomyces spororaveus]
MSGENQQVDAFRTPDAPPSPTPVPAGPGQPGPASPSRAMRLAVPAFYLAGVTAAFAYVGAVDPNEPGHYPVCPLFRLTGVLCPGCGGLRSAHAFAHGDLVTALGANALAVVGYFVFAGFMALWLVRAFRGGPTPRIVLRRRYWWAIGALALVFVIVRNLSFGSALAP